MPENFILKSLISQKNFKNNNIKLYNEWENYMSISQYTEIEESLSIFWISGVDYESFESLFSRWYLDKIVWIEYKLIALKAVWFQLSIESLLDLCIESKSDLEKNIQTYDSLFPRLRDIQDVWFQFDGKSFWCIEHIDQFTLLRIAGYQEQLKFLYDFWVRFHLSDWEYFHFNWETVNMLFSLGEKLKMDWKIGLKISIKNISEMTLSEYEKRKKKKISSISSETKFDINDILNGKTSWIIQKNNLKNSIIKYDYIYDLLSEHKKDIWALKNYIKISDSNSFNGLFLYDINGTTFDIAWHYIDTISILLEKIWATSIAIHDFVKLTYLFCNKKLLDIFISLLENWYSISLSDFIKNSETFKKIDQETVEYILKIKSIHDGADIDDTNLITHVINKKWNVKLILQQEARYIQLIWWYKSTFWSEEMMFEGGEFSNDIVSILYAENFVELWWFFEKLKTNSNGNPYHDIWFERNLAFLMKINPIAWDFNILIDTCFQYNLRLDLFLTIESHMLHGNIKYFREYLEKFAIEWLWSVSAPVVNELVILCNAFSIEVGKQTKEFTYRYNIHSLLWWKKIANISSLDEIIEKLKQTWFHTWKITKDNIEEIGALLNSWMDEKKLDMFVINNDIDTYKKIVRALWEYMYDNFLNKKNYFIQLLGIFWSIFQSNFLKDLSRNTWSKAFYYMLWKKVRLQDIEKVYENYNNIFSLDINNEYYKFCLDYALDNDNYDYLEQNIETIKYLIESWFFLDLLWKNTPKNLKWMNVSNIIFNIIETKNIELQATLTSQNLIKLLENILLFTWWYLTISMVKWYIEDGKSLEELLKESLEAKKEVLSPNPIRHLNLATYETIFLAYRPTGFTIDSIKTNIENGNISDMSEHLRWINYSQDWYKIELFERSYTLEWEQDEIVVNWVDQILKWHNILNNIENIAHPENEEKWILQWLNLKLFFSTSTNLLSKEDGNNKINQWIFTVLRDIYAMNTDSRIASYRNNFCDGEFNYERLSELKEIFSVVTKDSFDTVISNEINKLKKEEQLELWEKIWKLKDKNLKAKYDELNANHTELAFKIKEIFFWRLLEYAKSIRKYITAEMKKFSEIKWSQTQVKAVLSKNVWSFFAKAGAWLCTSENYDMWREARHIHLNLIDEQKQEIIWNVMLYFEPGRNYLIVRWFNPRADIESAYDVPHMVDEMIRVVKEIAVQNWYIDEKWEALVYIPPQDHYHAVSNREKVRKRISYIVWKVWESIHNANFSANKMWMRTYHTLHKI